jgi:hypothetical protein
MSHEERKELNMSMKDPRLKALQIMLDLNCPELQKSLDQEAVAKIRRQLRVRRWTRKERVVDYFEEEMEKAGHLSSLAELQILKLEGRAGENGPKGLETTKEELQTAIDLLCRAGLLEDHPDMEKVAKQDGPKGGETDGRQEDEAPSSAGTPPRATGE